jgi:hypothetical protein
MADPSPKLLGWLTEENNTAVRYIAFRDLVKSPPDYLVNLPGKAHASGPIAEILANLNTEGYWSTPGAGYNPKYTGTVWSTVTDGCFYRE